MVGVKRGRPARTVLEVCVARCGPLKGGRVAAFIAQWTMASQALGRPITIEDYAEWWLESERTVYRQQARFRAAFPHMQTPQPIANAAIARRAEWLDRGVPGIGDLPAAVVVEA